MQRFFYFVANLESTTFQNVFEALNEEEIESCHVSTLCSNFESGSLLLLTGDDGVGSRLRALIVVYQRNTTTHPSSSFSAYRRR